MITDEGQKLGHHWDLLGEEMLDRYLIQDVEHPAYNAQSVLIRAFLVDRFFPIEGRQLIDEEIYFAACSCFALLGHREGWFSELYRKLKLGCSDSDLPAFLRSEYRERLGSRFSLLDLYSEIAISIIVGFDDFRSPFESLWRDFLRGRKTDRTRVLELGCGSANDYRFFDSYGLTSLVDYSGIDVSKTNIRNAKKRFPNAEFSVGDVCAIEASDQSFDVTVAFDLYEHLSMDALSAGLSESLRVTKDEHWISCFNAADIPIHQIRPVDDYHWNLLSLSELKEFIQIQGFDVEIVSTSQQFEDRFEGYRHYNQEAHILIANRRSNRVEQGVASARSPRLRR